MIQSHAQKRLGVKTGIQSQSSGFLLRNTYKAVTAEENFSLFCRKVTCDSLKVF